MTSDDGTQRLRSERVSYGTAELDHASIAADPVAAVKAWITEAVDTAPPRETLKAEPNAMALATVDEAGLPDVRFVLCRGTEGGVRWFTNATSVKGQQLRAVAAGAVSFWWPWQHRQLRLRGLVERLPEADVDAYWQSRPRESQLASAASPQSSVIPDRAWLEDRIAELAGMHPDGADVPRPEVWSGYVLRPTAIEFWQGRDHRVHDRLLATRADVDVEIWDLQRLAP